MINSTRMAIVDRNAAELGVPQSKLMENAGAATARQTKKHLETHNEQILIVAGTGNNGGDALVATRFLAGNPLQENHLDVLLLGREESIKTDIARENLQALKNTEVDITEIKDSTTLPTNKFIEADVILDGMLGTGFTGDLREPALRASELMNESDAYVVSLDVPSGIEADTGKGTGVEPDLVVTFHDEKPAHKKITAETVVADIGIPPAAEKFVGIGDLTLLKRKPDSHKGSHGEVLVVGGGPYSGAPALTGEAALRAGCDIARIATPSNNEEVIKGYSENLIVEALDGDHLNPGHTERVLELAEVSDTVVIGPGLGGKKETIEAIHEILPSLSNVVVDAEATQCIDSIPSNCDGIITPHAGELAKLIDDVPGNWRQRAEFIEKFSDKRNITTLLKGRYDVISNGEDTRINRTGNPFMTVGGTGDVLAGICGANLGRLDSMDAACIAAYVNGKAGDIVVEKQGRGLVATDLIEEIPTAKER